MQTKSSELIKRTLDVAGALVALVVLSPVLALVALAVLMSMGAPILYRQTRVGRGGEPFTLLKFRTMDDVPHEVMTFEELVASDEVRLTGLGRFLRATSLDELPQLLNVVRGEMSFVGPRPLPVEYLSLYSAEQARRHEVRPGITGLAQVSGRNALSWPERFALDVAYVDERSLTTDARILVQTIGAVFSRRGISSDSAATMEPFRGNE